METNKCSMSKTLKNVHYCMCRSTRHSQILDLCNVSGSYCESVTLHPLGTADHNCMHFILVCSTLLKMFWHGLMILQWLSGAVWTVQTETSFFLFETLQWYWWPQRCCQRLGVTLYKYILPYQHCESISKWPYITKSSLEWEKERPSRMVTLLKEIRRWNWK